ncbi:MAG: hypothetical protein JNK37_19065 [Verrucomicrobiales bacterium]|nr:hypothetical protein [Verrucomicrobiales bacterium]
MDFDPVRAIPAAVVLFLQPVVILVVELEFAGIAVAFIFVVAVVLIEFFLVVPAAAAAFLLVAVGILVEFAPVAGAAVSPAVVEFGAGVRGRSGLAWREGARISGCPS